MGRLPQVKAFLTQDGNIDLYNDVDINWSPGAKPVLVIKEDNGDEIERIDLSPFSTEELHALMAEKGFTKKETNRSEL